MEQKNIYVFVSFVCYVPEPFLTHFVVLLALPCSTITKTPSLTK